jgi:HPt (histidine-containing phosphotransfer) domain-containing protein
MRDLLLAEPLVWLELVQWYLEDTEANLVRLEQQVLRRDTGEAGMTLHSLKGSSRQIGGLSLGDLVEKMEGTLHSDGVDATRPALPGLRLALESLRSEMEDAIVALASRQPGG